MKKYAEKLLEKIYINGKCTNKIIEQAIKKAEGRSNDPQNTRGAAWLIIAQSLNSFKFQTDSQDAVWIWLVDNFDIKTDHRFEIYKKQLMCFICKQIAGTGRETWEIPVGLEVGE